MRIAIITDEFPPAVGGGAGKIAQSLALALQQNGNDVVVITITDDVRCVGEVTEEGLRIIRIYSQYHPRWRSWISICNPRVVLESRRLLARFQPEHVHFHNIHMHFSYAVLVLVSILKIPSIVTLHDAVPLSLAKLQPVDGALCDAGEKQVYNWGWWRELRYERLRFNPLRSVFARWSLKFAAHRIAVSDALHDVYTDARIRTHVIRNGIDASQWSNVMKEETQVFRTKYLLGDKKVVLFGGRLSGLKGAFVSVESLVIVRRTVPSAVLLVIGKKDAVGERIQAEAERLGLRDAIVFTGWISGIERICAYQVSDVCITPSLYLDPFPTINLEAFACGKPVVATCFGGSRELVEDGVSGYIVNPFNRTMLAERIIELLQNPEKAHTMGAAGRARVEKEFTLQRQAQQYLDLFHV